MKVIFYLFFASALLFTSCSKDNDIQGLESSDNGVTTRASNLGYSDVKSYTSSVLSQCALGNHENCEILADGTHQACPFPDHDGITHDGKHINGTAKGGHSHYNGETHNAATCTDKSHNHGTTNGGTHDVATCNDITHNHGETNNGNTDDVATCTDKSHNHGTTNNSNNHNGGGHHK